MSLSAGSRKRRLASWRYPSRPWTERSGREGRRVYVRMHGPESLGDDELLRRAIIREDEPERTVQALEQSASKLERERDEAREAASAGRDAYDGLMEAYRKERAAHGQTKTIGSLAKPAQRLRPVHPHADPAALPS